MNDGQAAPDNTPCPQFCIRQDTPEHRWSAVDSGYVREHLAARWPAVPRDGTGAVHVEAGASEFDDGTMLPAVWISLDDRSGELTADESRRLAEYLEEAAGVADRLSTPEI